MYRRNRLYSGRHVARGVALGPRREAPPATVSRQRDGETRKGLQPQNEDDRGETTLGVGVW